ncbi:MAG: hypothetical protein HKN87_05145 [Saprospiraceae bacterium]|nr:hypothetical protein [Saprospiraceae bacterium]
MKDFATLRIHGKSLHAFLGILYIYAPISLRSSFLNKLSSRQKKRAYV